MLFDAGTCFTFFSFLSPSSFFFFAVHQGTENESVSAGHAKEAGVLFSSGRGIGGRHAAKMRARLKKKVNDETLTEDSRDC